MADLSPNAITRRARTKGGVVTIITVLGLVAAMGLTWFGLSVNDHVSAGYDSSMWMWSLTRGELARVNGITGKVDTRQAMAPSQGHQVQVSQTDRYLILRDQATGKVSALDPATLQITATLDTQQGAGPSIALHEQAAFVIDPVQGVVRQLDPATLQPVGEPLRYPPGITGGNFDGLGRLWIAVPSQGTVSAITPAPVTPVGAGAGGGGAGSPTQVRTEAVAEPSHDLVVSTLDNGVAVLDQTNGTLTTLRGDVITKVAINQAAGGDLPARSGGPDVPVTVVEGRHVYIVSGESVHEFTVPGTGGRLRPAVAWAGRFYITDDAVGTVYSFDGTGALQSTIAFTAPGGPLEIEVRENHLFINAPGSATARVVNDKHEIKTVDKFARDVTGGEPPPVQPPVTQQETVGKPSSPRNVTAAAGDMQVRLTWGKAAPNGSKITKYIVEGAGKTWTVGASQRSLVVGQLVNGQTYTFTVRAVNGKGEGPTRKSNPVVPTRDVPDAPGGITAQEKPDGTVVVSWTAANGQGRKITRYEVTAVTTGGGSLIGTASGTSLTVKAGDLDYGTQYAFTVVAVNDKGAGSQPSTASNSVVPFTKPDAVRGLSAATVAAAKGTIRVAWQAPADNGRPITGYKVTVGANTQTVTGVSATLNGFADGATVTVKVAAVNAAGTGDPATTSAKTIDLPTVSNVTTSAVNYNDMVIRFAYDDGGGTAACSLTVNGSAGAIPCSSGAGGYTQDGLWPNSVYNYTVTVSTAAGTAVSAQQGPRTPVLQGTVVCRNTNQYGVPTYCNSGIWSYATSSQNGSGIRAYQNGRTFAAQCKKNGSTAINAVAYNGGKSSTWWVRIAANEYLPFCWFNLDGGDNLNMIPSC